MKKNKIVERFDEDKVGIFMLDQNDKFIINILSSEVVISGSVKEDEKEE